MNLVQHPRLVEGVASHGGRFGPSTNVTGSTITAADPGLTVFLVTFGMPSRVERPVKTNQAAPEPLVQLNEGGIRTGALVTLKRVDSTS